MRKTIPVDFIEKWQSITDLIADIFYVPAALIMKAENEIMEVFISSNSENNPYNAGDTEKWHGLYCENVIKTQKSFLVTNALADENWNTNPDIKLGMIAYLGFPINYPDNTPFGTICVLDYKENPFNQGYQQLLLHFKEIIEFDLKTIDTFGEKTEELNQTIFEQYNNLKKINLELLETAKLLQDSRSKYKQLSDLSYEGVIIHKNGIALEANLAFLKIMGYDEEDIIGKDVITNLALEKYHSQIYENIKNEVLTPYDVEAKRKDGSIIQLEVESKTIGLEGSDIIRVAAIRDISYRKKAEGILKKKNNELIREQEKALENIKQFQRLFENMEQGFALHEMIYDKEGNPIDYRYILINKAFENLTGINAKGFIGKTVKEVLPNVEDIWIQNYGKVAQTGQNMRFEEYSAVFKKHYDVVAYSPKKNLFAVIFTDVTKIKNYQKELIIAKEKAEESDKLKTEFFNNMSHEIRTPLNGIMGFTSILVDLNLSDEDRKSYTDIILGCGDQLLRVVDDILEVSMLETKQTIIDNDILCLNTQMRKLFSDYYSKALEKNIKLEMELGLGDDKCSIVTDEYKLTRIMHNLLENAIKFTNEGSVKFGYILDDERIVIHVVDTGIGINPLHHDTVFNRFSQEEKSLSQKVGGLGLGLAIVKENVNLLGGEISLVSEKGKGASFLFSLPYTHINPKPEEKTSLKKQRIIHTILVAEDEETSCLYINTLLNSFGYKSKVIHAKNGQEAVDLCLTNNNIELVLMDIRMPVLNGYEATEIIKKSRPQLPIIAQTAYSTSKDIDAALSIGFDDFISKPINKDRFKKVIDKYLTQE